MTRKELWFWTNTGEDNRATSMGNSRFMELSSIHYVKSPNVINGRLPPRLSKRQIRPSRLNIHIKLVYVLRGPLLLSKVTVGEENVIDQRRWFYCSVLWSLMNRDSDIRSTSQVPWDMDDAKQLLESETSILDNVRKTTPGCIQKDLADLEERKHFHNYFLGIENNYAKILHRIFRQAKLVSLGVNEEIIFFKILNMSQEAAKNVRTRIYIRDPCLGDARKLFTTNYLMKWLYHEQKTLYGFIYFAWEGRNCRECSYALICTYAREEEELVSIRIALANPGNAPRETTRKSAPR